MDAGIIVICIALLALAYCLFLVGRQVINEHAVEKLAGVRSEIIQLVDAHNSKHGTDYVYVIFTPSYYDEDTYFTSYGIFTNAELRRARRGRDVFAPVMNIKLHSNDRIREALTPRFFLRRMEMVKRGTYPLEQVHALSVKENLESIASYEHGETKTKTYKL